MEDKSIKELLFICDVDCAIHDTNSYKKIKEFSNDTLMTWLCYLEKIIKQNFESQIFSRNVKNNLYNILSIYRDRFKDSLILEKINELISILNKSNESNVHKKIKEEFNMRLTPIFSKGMLKISKAFDIDDLESFVTDSICADYTFLDSLINDNDVDFFDLTTCDFIYLSSLYYILSHYDYILKDKKIVDKILRLLESNMEISKDLKRKSLEQDNSLKEVYHESKVCLKKIKKLKIDR